MSKPIDSPFQVGQPVSSDKFKGREEIIDEISKYFPAIIRGKPQHFFVTGKRGMGKTYLANFISDYARNNYSMVTAHIMNDGVHSIDELITQIIERILNSIKSEKWSDKIFKYFENNIESVGLGGINIKFNPSKKELKNIKDNFALYLIDLLNNFKDKDGIFIIIDDINGLTDTPEFANWYKSFADTMATSYMGESKIGIMLTGYPENYNKLFTQNPSVNRIFHYYNLEGLKYDEIMTFYKNAFDLKKIKWDETALNFMSKYTSGMPTMMQEIGEATFFADEDSYIDVEDSMKGVITAGNIIGLKYLQQVLDKKIRSEHYLSIFSKIGEKLANSPDGTFTRKEFLDLLTESESKVF